jgi:hypothetical protein
MKTCNTSPPSRDLAILGFIARLGYLNVAHLAKLLGLPEEDVGGMVNGLCRDELIKPLLVPDHKRMYWLKVDGLRAVGEIVLPQHGTLGLADIYGRVASDFCRSGLSDSSVMPHTLACADLAVALELAVRDSGGVVLGERMLRFAEKVLYEIEAHKPAPGKTRIGTAINGHSPDIAVLYKRRKPVVVEVEASHHTPKEGKATFGAYADSDHIARVCCVPIDELAAREMTRRVGELCSRRKGSRRKLDVQPYMDGELPTAEELLAA